MGPSLVPAQAAERASGDAFSQAGDRGQEVWGAGRAQMPLSGSAACPWLQPMSNEAGPHSLPARLKPGPRPAL